MLIDRIFLPLLVLLGLFSGRDVRNRFAVVFFSRGYFSSVRGHGRGSGSRKVWWVKVRRFVILGIVSLDKVFLLREMTVGKILVLRWQGTRLPVCKYQLIVVIVVLSYWCGSVLRWPCH